MDTEIIITQLLPGDVAGFRGLLGVFAEAFEMKDLQMPGDFYLGTLLARKDFIVFVAAMAGGTGGTGGSGGTGSGRPGGIIGGLTAHTLASYYAESSEAYLYDLAVKSEFRRKGVGRKLIGALADYCRVHGFSEFFVQADAPDEHALEFYRALGGKPEKVVHYTFNASY